MPYIELNTRVRNEADLVLAVGTRFGETDWWGKPPYWRSTAEQRMIQVDVDEQVLGLNKPIDLADRRRRARVPHGACSASSPSATSPTARASTRGEAARIPSGACDARAALDAARAAVGAPMHSSHVAPICQEVFDDDAVLVIDGGNTAIWANLYHEVRVPHTLLSTYKFGMLGAGVGQALGAQAALPGPAGLLHHRATARWGSTPRRSRPPCATTCRSCSSCCATGSGAW